MVESVQVNFNIYKCRENEEKNGIRSVTHTKSNGLIKNGSLSFYLSAIYWSTQCTSYALSPPHRFIICHEKKIKKRRIFYCHWCGCRKKKFKLLIWKYGLRVKHFAQASRYTAYFLLFSIHNSNHIRVWIYWTLIYVYIYDD